jgi:hypothetical protein
LRVARIDAGAGGTLADAECPETRQDDIIALLQVFGNALDDRLKGGGGGFFGDAGGLGPDPTFVSPEAK